MAKKKLDYEIFITAVKKFKIPAKSDTTDCEEVIDRLLEPLESEGWEVDVQDCQPMVQGARALTIGAKESGVEARVNRCWWSYSNILSLRSSNRKLVERSRVAERAVTDLADSVGASLSSCKPVVERICEVLEKSIHTREKPDYYDDLTKALINKLRTGINYESNTPTNY